MSTLQILLATCNSARFLTEQIDSLLTQDFSDIEILINDGGSQDNTLEIITDYQKRFPEKVRLLGSAPAAACENFAKLLAAADSELIMFCDHDDVWKKDKISLSIQAYRKMESEYGSDLPILVFTDSEIVDGNLTPVLPSMMRSQCLNRTRFTPGRTLMQNYASGNTMLFNRALQKRALPVAGEALMHDHWLALAAAFFGKVCYVDTPTILYRQHGSNVVGSFRYDAASCLKKFFAESGSFRKKLHAKITQAEKLLEQNHSDLTPEQSRFLDSLKCFKNMKKSARFRFLKQYDMLYEGKLRNLALYFSC